MSIIMMSTEISNITLGNINQDINPELDSIQGDAGNEIAKNLTSTNFLKGKRGLVVDYDKKNVYVNSVLLKHMGAYVQSTTNLNEATEILKNGNIDFIIISPHFPRDGRCKMEEDDFVFLSEVEENYPEIPMFAFTGSVLPKEIEELKMFKFTDIFELPIFSTKILKQSLYDNVVTKIGNNEEN